MSNADLIQGLDRLKTSLAAGEVSAESAAVSFERMVWMLEGVSRDDDRRLADMVNEIELIRFTRIEANQPGAIGEVLQRALDIFARYR